jgi:hypothetical protein
LFAGILTVLCFFATILLKTGFNNIISGVSNILNNPVYGQMVGKRNYFDILHSMVIYTWQNIPYNKLILADLFIVLATYKIVPVKFRALYRIGTLALFIACAHNAFNQPAALSVSHMFLNISAFMPVVFFMLSSENIKSAAQLIMYLYLPSWMGYLGITLFSAGTYLQAQQTLLPATISTVGAFCLLFGEQLKSRKAVEVPVQKKIKSIKWAYIPYFGIPVLICISILYLNWSYCYRDVSPAYADTHISTGIYAGLNTSKTTAEIVTSAEKDIRAVTDQYGNGKIQFFECFPAGYAMTNMRAGAQDLFSSTYYLYGNNSVDSIFRYYDKVSGMPDIIVYMQKSLTPPEYGKDSFKNLDDPVYPVQAFINEFYTPVLKTDNYYIFKKAKSGAKFTLENGKYVENALEFKLLNGISCEYEANIAAGTLFEDKNGVRTLQPKGTSGYMNVDLNPGKYKIEISGNNLDGVQYNFTYSNNKNQQKVGEISNASANQNKISYDLQLNKLSNDIAVNINNTTDHTVEITSIKITPQ